MSASRCRVLVPATLLITLAVRPATAADYDWGSATTGGDWTTTTAWSPTAPTNGPGSGDTATLVDATADRTINYNSTTGSLTTLAFDQTSAFDNELVVQRNLTVANAIALGASSGTERISLVPGVTSNLTLTATGGITVSAGGELAFGVYRPAGTSHVGQLAGDLTIDGGFVELAAASGGGTNTGTNTLTGSLTMSSGTFGMNVAVSGDRRLTVNGDVNITGGSITRGFGTPQLQLYGETNLLEPDAFNTAIATSLYRNGDQSLDTSIPLGKLISRGWGIKTVTSTEAAGTVNELTLIDGNNDSGGTPIGTTLKLAADITSTLGLRAETFSQSPSASGRVDYGVDVQTHTLAMPAAFVPGLGVPSSGSITDAVWTIAGNGGTIRATRFDFSTADVTTEVGSGLTLEATGGDSTDNVLSGTGTIAAVFRYAGDASQTSPATLTSTRDIGTIEVATGALNLISLNNAGSVVINNVANGATLSMSADVSDADAASILANGTFAAGSSFGFNTFGENRTFTPAVTGAIGLVKIGGRNNLRASGENTYTGDTLIDGGFLELNRPDGNSYAGVISGSGGLTLTNAGTLTLSGASTYAGATNLAASLVLSGGNDRLPSTTTLNLTGLSSTLDVGSTTQNLAALTVPVSGDASLAIVGSGGTVAISGPSSLQIGPGGTVTSADSVALDMSSLANFSYSNTSTGVFRVGMQGNSNSGALGEIARVTLAGSNTITADSILISDRGGNTDGGAATLLLGQANTLETDVLNVGYSGRSDATLEFATGLTSPSARIRAKDGSSPLPDWFMGNVANFTSGTYNSAANFSAGTLDAEVTNLYVGSAVIGTQTNRAGTQNATLTMGAGTLSAGTITLGRIFSNESATVSNTLAANGTLTIGTAGGSVVADSVLLAVNGYLGGTTAARTVSGTINLSAGTLAATSIALGAQTGNATATTAFNWSGGTIANKAGSGLTITSVPISLASGTGTFSAESGQSITVESSSPISGAGSVTKSGAGTLVLEGAHSYAGSTSIAAGTLTLPSGASLATSGLEIASGAVLDVSGLAGGLALGTKQLGGAGSILGSLVFGAESKLAFASSLTVDSGTVTFNGFGVADIVGLDGTLVSAGTYTLLDGTATFDLTNALNVGAGNPADIGGGKTAYFQEGSFQVVVVPEPATLGVIVLVAAGLVAARRRRSTRAAS